MKCNGKKLQLFVIIFWIGFIPNLLSSAELKNGPQVVSSLQWGEVLFSYFRGDKADALVRLYARESRNNFPLNQTEADLLAAGLLLDLGLASEAQKRLDKIDVTQLNSVLKSRLSLVMARVYFQNQEFELTHYWLQAIVDESLSSHELAVKKMMQAQLYFSIGDYALAAEQLKSIEDKGNLQHYADYNNGLSLLKSVEQSDRTEGRALLKKVDAINPQDQEQYALIDQAKLALGLDALNSGYSIDARQHFINIRLDGLVSNDALLMIGWTFAQTEHFEEALTYWNRLAAKTDRLEPAIQESWLAVPYAHQQLGNLSLAVKEYEKAIRSQTEAQTQLKLMLNEDSWRILLADSNPELFSKGIIRQLNANPKFYNLFKQWQQLQQLQDRLQASLSILPTLAFALQENELRYAQKSSLIDTKLKLLNLQNHADDYQLLDDQFQQQKMQDIAEKTLSKEDYHYWTKLESLDSRINTMPSEIDAAKIEKYRLINGVAKWKFHRQRDENLWLVENNLAKLNHSLKQLTDQVQKLKILSSKPRASITEDVERIKSLLSQGEQSTQRLNELKNDFETAMSEEFADFVKTRQDALTALAEQANTALARLRFRALKESVQ